MQYANTTHRNHMSIRDGQNSISSLHISHNALKFRSRTQQDHTLPSCLTVSMPTTYSEDVTVSTFSREIYYNDRSLVPFLSENVWPWLVWLISFYGKNIVLNLAQTHFGTHRVTEHFRFINLLAPQFYI